MRASKVAILDYGINSSHIGLEDINIEEIFVHPERVKYEESDWDINARHNIFHATNIASIIAEGLPEVEIVFYALGIDNSIDQYDLCAGLELCIERGDVDIICISLGFKGSHPSERLFKICNECHLQGKIIIGAVYWNIDLYCFPAAFPFVIGVGAAITDNPYDYEFIGDDYITVFARGDYQKLIRSKEKYGIGQGPSFAVAYFTVSLINLRIDCFKNLDLHQILRGASKSVKPLTTRDIGIKNGHRKECYHSICTREEISKICSNGLFFPYTDQFHSLFYDFENSSLFNVKYLLNFPSALYHDKEYSNYTYIHGRISSKLFRAIDSIILSRCPGGEQVINKLFWIDVVKYSIEFNINIVALSSDIFHFVKSRIEEWNMNYQGVVVNLVEQSCAEILSLNSYRTYPLPNIDLICILGTLKTCNVLNAFSSILKSCSRKYGIIGTNVLSKVNSDCLVLPLVEGDRGVFHRKMWSHYFINSVKYLQEFYEVDSVLIHIDVFEKREDSLSSNFLSAVEFIDGISPTFNILEIGENENIEGFMTRADRIKTIMNIRFDLIVSHANNLIRCESDKSQIEQRYGCKCIWLNEDSELSQYFRKSA